MVGTQRSACKPLAMQALSAIGVTIVALRAVARWLLRSGSQAVDWLRG